ncbi:MAG TPA: class I SAM-dependent methyltransferase, partial [Gemmatimonadaceae bacterium]
MPRTDAMCPQCGALERHRFVWLYFAQRTNLFDTRPKRLLHIAPEPCFRDRLARHIGAGYVTADMRREGVAETMDIMNIPHPDRSFDIVYCSHVLEHVPNDRAAMRECARV